MLGLPCFRASLFGRQSLGLFFTYSSCIGQTLPILFAASLPQSVGEHTALLSAVSNAVLVGGGCVCPCPGAQPQQRGSPGCPRPSQCSARLEQANPGFSMDFLPRCLVNGSGSVGQRRGAGVGGKDRSDRPGDLHHPTGDSAITTSELAPFSTPIFPFEEKQLFPHFN